MALPPVLAIDLDGTLVDTAPDLLAALNAVLTHERLPNLTIKDATSMIGGGARLLLERGLEAVGARRSREEVDALFTIFLDRYRTWISRESRPYPGVIEAVDRFAAAGWKLAVCTNKLESLSRQLLDELAISARFAAIAGGDTFDVRKPNAQHLLKTIALAGGDPKRSVMVGDSDTDIATAKAAGIPVVVVNFGYTTIPVEKLDPDRIISHFDQLWDAVAALPQRAA